ncbi:hypothetical protein PXH69_21640 [Rhodococcus qingshengii]|uniref:Uncharacterized protein n=1 Tax=Rhodococcus qingshengii TaxID=334542 RepID=A0AAW6LQ30_RHOSG|nr:hypothetical protein [Rhodococcus qingshengii]MDE8647581.1 hypothetical protein [Rhodococcus qingshengii]
MVAGFLAIFWTVVPGVLGWLDELFVPILIIVGPLGLASLVLLIRGFVFAVIAEITERWEPYRNDAEFFAAVAHGMDPAEVADAIESLTEKEQQFLELSQRRDAAFVAQDRAVLLAVQNRR